MDAGRPYTSTQFAVARAPETSTTPFGPGTRIKQYELIRELGRGGMGVVYSARDVRLGRRVAIKFLREVDREVVERFLIEARATAQCSHDNIVIIHDVDEHEGNPYMVLELLEGRTLREVMGPFDNAPPMAPSRVVELMLPVARALARAHGAGIVHRDLKPENVLVTHNGQVKVLDFGIAKALGGSDDRASRPAFVGEGMNVTNAGAMVGTLPYMSPEQMGIDEVDHRSDLFAIGIIMSEMLAGRHPVQPLGTDTLFANLVNPEAMFSIRAAVPEVPVPLALAIDSCLIKQKANRMTDATELARRLESMLPGRHGRQLGEGEGPFPGLAAFQEKEADRFFGRRREVARMVARIREQPLTAIVGPSGVGKSSFVRAGVGPALKSSAEIWDVVALRPGKHPIAALASVIERIATRVGASAASTLDEHHALIAQLRHEPGYLGATLRGRARETDSNMLLFVDQFEELYTLVPDPAERRAFTAALAAVGDDPASPLRVVVSMRSDFLDRVAEDPEFLEELSRGLVFMAAPDRASLQEALELPVEMAGYRFESPAIVHEMLDALASTPGAFPLLQFTAAKLWDGRDREQRMLTLASHRTTGGVLGALATYADEVVASMRPTSQRLTERIFRRLVTPDRTRALVELVDLQQLGTPGSSHDELAQVIDQLVAARLLVVQTHSDGGGAVELVHESLIERWPMLRRWLDEDQENAQFLAQLGAAAKQWDAKGRAQGLLWRGETMEEARRFDAHNARALTARDRAFLDEVLALARRGRRMRTIALVASFAVVSVVAAIASVAYVRVSSLKDEATLARRDAELALASERQQATRTKQAQAAARTATDQAALADEDRIKAEQRAVETGTELGLSKEELQRKNEELVRTAAAASAAQTRAEAERQKAQRAATDAEAARAELQKKLEAERRAREAERMSTTLKDR